MRLNLVQITAVAGAVSFWLALPALGQTVQVMVPKSKLIAFGIRTWYNSTDGSTKSVGPYRVRIDGGPLQKFVCDDYAGDIVNGETWTATEVKVASITTSNIDSLGLKFASTIGIKGYAEIGLLVEDMLSGHSGFTDAELSSAIWYITSDNSSVVKFGALDTKAQALVLYVKVLFAGPNGSLLAQDALAHETGLDILTNSSGHQEGWVSTAEGGAALLYLLLAFGSCFGAIVLNFRKRTRVRQAI
ncbi:MAG: hypothetical protein ACRD3N_08790 [Terracidiphilus sp.]